MLLSYNIDAYSTISPYVWLMKKEVRSFNMAARCWFTWLDQMSKKQNGISYTYTNIL
jgi:hypothetical protein